MCCWFQRTVGPQACHWRLAVFFCVNAAQQRGTGRWTHARAERREAGPLPASTHHVEQLDYCNAVAEIGACIAWGRGGRDRGSQTGEPLWHKHKYICTTKLVREEAPARVRATSLTMSGQCGYRTSSVAGANNSSAQIFDSVGS